MNDNKIKLIILVALIFLSIFSAVGLTEEKGHIILIDPGHGGSEKGFHLAGDVYEKDVTLAVALLVKKELSREKNIKVVLVRENDDTIDVDARRRTVEKVKPEFLLSLHVNGGFDKHASGFEIYYPRYDEKTIMERSAKKDKRSLKDKLGNNSLTMAGLIQDNMNVLFPRKGRGLRKADNPDSSGLQVPCVTLEMGFGTNAEDIKKLTSAKTQSDISKAIADSIRKYFR